MKILVTGSAGFIGSALSLELVKRKHLVLGIDNHNKYYDPILKKMRIKRLKNFSKYKHLKLDLTKKKKLDKIFKSFKPNIVVNLAAQAGVRYSIKEPLKTIKNNILTFSNILEACISNKVKHLIYASTSSVYGANTNKPFSESHCTDHPLSIYAASKKSNELMAHAYSHLYKLSTTGLRFFTVYGPWGRPDMALFKFTKSILQDKPIHLFNYGNHTRDFTYIDDIINGIIKVINTKTLSNLKWNSNKPDPATSKYPWRVYNIGNSKPVPLIKYVSAIENALGKKAKLKFLPLQKGDVPDTFADIKIIKKNLNYLPKTSINSGVKKFVKWYLDYYNVRFKN